MKVLSQQKVLGLIGQIYDAAADERLWPTFLEAFADAVAGTATAIVHCDFQKSGANVGASTRFDPDYVGRYNTYYGNCDTWKAAWRARFSRASTEAIVTSEELINPDQLDKTEFFNDYLLPQDTVHQFGGPINISEGRWCSTFTCLRPRTMGPFEAEAVELLRLLFPHLQKALQFHRKMADLDGCQRACHDALNFLPTGIILLDQGSRVLAVNRAAQQMLDQNDGLTIGKEGLTAATPNQNRDLRASVAAAKCAAQGAGFSAGGSFAIARPSGKRPFTVITMPSSVHAFPAEGTSAAVIVFVSDPEARQQAVPELLASIYDLTVAESRLAQQLMQGETLVRAAELLGVSHNTVRTHLQRIYAKTGTSHQGDLVRLLFAGGVNLSNKP
jgi:DNA-binding CsgD family transcriptional regulator